MQTNEIERESERAKKKWNEIETEEMNQKREEKKQRIRNCLS